MIVEMKVTETTRKHLLDELGASRYPYNGALSEPDFLGRLWDLRRLPTTDYRTAQYPTMLEDLQQHRVNNPTDWRDDWVYNDPRLDLRAGPDKLLLEFLSRMVDPLVRPDAMAVAHLLEVFNRHLKPDGLEFVEVELRDNRPVYGARPIGAGPAIAVQRASNLAQLGAQVRQQLQRLDPEGDPALTIGTAKDILESVCKTILLQLGVGFQKDDQLPALATKLCDLLELVPLPWPEADRSVRKLLGHVRAIPHDLCELRNLAGTGHGRSGAAPDLLPMHARLAADAATTFANFVIEAAQGRLGFMRGGQSIS